MTGNRNLNLPRPARVRMGHGGAPREVDGRPIEQVRESWLVEDRWWTRSSATSPLLGGARRAWSQPRRLPRPLLRRLVRPGRLSAAAGGRDRAMSAETTTTQASYAELHCHSAYSFLDGASLPAELAQRADELGYTALALTDHNSVSGSMELAQAVRGVRRPRDPRRRDRPRRRTSSHAARVATRGDGATSADC